MRVIHVVMEPPELVLLYDYDPLINTRVKSIMGWRYDPGTKTWRVPVASLEELICEFGCSLDFVTPYEEILEAASAPPWDPEDVDLSAAGLLKIRPYHYQIVAGTAFLPKVKQALLADDVGLGKTASAILGFAYLHTKGIAKKALVICKKDLKSQWLAEIEKFTDFKGIVITGSADKRERLYSAALADDVSFVIMNYEQLLYDLEHVKKVCAEAQVIIADEAQKFKDYTTKTHRCMLKLDAPYKWLLTGTPLENKPADLYSICRFMNPNIFGRNPRAFMNRYYEYSPWGYPIGPKNLDDLARRIAPYMLRRRQKDVENEFPEERSDLIYLDMTDDQAEIHEKIRVAVYDMLTDDDEDASSNVLGRFVLALQVADCPALLLGSTSPLAKKVLSEGKYSEASLYTSPKISWIYDFISEKAATSPQDKTLIFTRSDDMAFLIKKSLDEVVGGSKVVLYHGGMDDEARDRAIKAFWGDATVLVSTDAAREGLNLQCANCLVNVDLPYNPARLMQRRGRIVRTGSEHKHVRIISLISKGSVDERVLEIIYNKQVMIDKVIEANAAPVRLTNRIIKKMVSARRPKGGYGDDPA